jgi:hypothetical protein
VEASPKSGILKAIVLAIEKKRAVLLAISKRERRKSAVSQSNRSLQSNHFSILEQK